MEDRQSDAKAPEAPSSADPEPSSPGLPAVIPPRQQPGFFQRLAFLFRPKANVTIRKNLQDALAALPAGDQTISDEERAMLHNILRLREVRVVDMMVPRGEIEAVDLTTTLGDLLKLFETSGHSRMPVYDDTLDDPRGMVHIRDVVAYLTRTGRKRPRRGKTATAKVATAKTATTKTSTTKTVTTKTSAAKTSAAKSAAAKASTSSTKSSGAPNGNGKTSANGNGKSAANGANGVGLDYSRIDFTRTIGELKLVRDVLFVPPSMLASDLMARMQAQRIQMALVIDEYGGTDGLVSLEDVVEMVVGDIEDEHDEVETHVERVDDNTFIVDARIELGAAGKALGGAFVAAARAEDEDVDTIGGLIFSLLGRIPVRGEVIPAFGGYEMEILQADPRRIKRVRLARARHAQRRQPQRRDNAPATAPIVIEGETVTEKPEPATSA